MKRFTLARIVASACAVVAFAACETPPERIAAPSGPRKIPFCEVYEECDPPPDPPPPQTVTPPPIPLANRAGLVIHGNGYGLSGGPVADLGVRLVRFDYDWGDTYLRSDGGGPNDITMAQFRADGVEVLAGLVYRYNGDHQPHPMGTLYPDYARCDNFPQAACIPSGATFNAFLSEWQTFVGRTIRNNPGVRYWAAWNEPNDSAMFTGTQSQYIAMARSLCDTIRTIRQTTARTDLYCVGPDGGLHNDASIRQGEIAWVAQVDAVVGFDVISVHAYNWNTEMKGMVTEVKNALGGKPVWVTETGIPDPNFRSSAADPEFQEHDLVDKVVDVRLGSNVDALFYFDMQTNESGLMNGYSEVTGFGPMRPAYYALRKILSQSPGNWSAAYAGPAWGRCSTQDGDAPCDYAANPVLNYGGLWDCTMTAHVETRTVYGRVPVAGAVIMGYRGAGQYGRKQTDANGNATWTSNCNVEQGLYYANGENGWYFAPGTPNYFDGIAFSSTVKSQTRTFLVQR